MKAIWIIVLCVLISTAASVGMTSVWLTYFPSYTACAYLGVNSPEECFPGPLTGQSLVDHKRRFASNWAKSEAVVQTALKDARVMGTKWYRENSRDAAGSELARTRSAIAPCTRSAIAPVW